MKNLKEKKELIIKWANERDLIKNGITEIQELKLIEELGGLARGIIKNDKKLIQDSIGDVFVVLVILEELLKIKFDFKTFIFDKKNNQYLKFKTNATNLQMIKKIIKNPKSYAFLIFEITDNLELDFNECFELAYNEIKCPFSLRYK